MSSWVVRRARPADREWVVKQTADFMDYTGMGIPVDLEHLNQMFATWIGNSSCYLLIAENNGERRGVAAATLQPHFLNPSINIFSEMMWWVPEEHRHSRAGLILLDALDRLGCERAQLIAVATEHHSKLNAKTLIKRSYLPQETTYLKKVA